MGLGDALMASAAARMTAQFSGLPIALGDGTRIIWKGPEHEVFRYNSRLLRPEDLAGKRPGEFQWVHNYSGCRPYIDRRRMEAEFAEVFPGKPFTMKVQSPRLPWRYVQRWYVRDFGPGEIILSREEETWASQNAPPGEYAVFEPGVKAGASINKLWQWDKYAEVCSELSRSMAVIQFPGSPLLTGATRLNAPTYRHAVALLKGANLYVGTEGGLHHAAAAVKTPALVYYGGMHRSSMTGYEGQEFLERTEGEPCGQRVDCSHCKDIANDISVSEAFASIERLLSHG
jgi:hypothetical protein